MDTPAMESVENNLQVKSYAEDDSRKCASSVQSRIESFEKKISSANPSAARGARKLPLRTSLSLDNTKPYMDHAQACGTSRDLVYSHSHDATVTWDQADILPLVMEHQEDPISPGGSRAKCVVRLEGAKYTIGKSTVVNSTMKGVVWSYCVCTIGNSTGTRLNMKMRGPAGQGDSFSRGYCVYIIGQQGLQWGVGGGLL